MWQGLLRFDQLAENFNSAIEVRQLDLIKPVDGSGERFYSPRAALDQNALSLRRRDDSGEPFVVRIRQALQEAIVFQTGDNLGHRGRPYLLGAGKLAKCDGTCEDDDGQRRESRRG